MARLSVLADDSIMAPWALLEDFAKISTFAGRQIRSGDIRDCDALIVRSITSVNAALLDGSRVRLVGSATSGIDHIDTDYLQARHIQFINAPGSNANAVAEYCVSALAHLDCRPERQSLIGVIGAGATGSRFIDKARGLGFRVCYYDPLLSHQARSRIERTGATPSDVRQLLASAEVVSFHVPLTREGPYPTAHLLSGCALDLMRSNSAIINTSRGEVIDVAALRSRLAGNGTLRCIFDVWEREPDIDTDLLAQTVIGTPHIAGYSVEAKHAAGRAMIEGVARMAGVDPDALEWSRCAEPESRKLILAPEISDWRGAVMAALPLAELNQVFRSRIKHEKPALVFDGLRQTQARRHEYGHYVIRSDADNEGRVSGLQHLGFYVQPAAV